MKAYHPINLPEWLGSETCCVISEKGSTEFSIPQAIQGSKSRRNAEMHIA